MKMQLKKIHRDQKGQALIIVLALLAFGGLTIATSLNYGSTVLNSNKILKEKVEGTYSAEAGVDYAIWALENGEEVPEQLTQSVNGMTVNIEKTDYGTFTVYCGELYYVEDLPEHYDWINVNGTTECMAGTCNYTITVNWEGLPDTQRRLVELGVNLPLGYTFVAGSPGNFDTNISYDDPDETGESAGGSQWIKWTWNPGKGPIISSDNATQTQTFHISGSGEIEGDYCWVTAQSNDVGLVGEITGQRLSITGTATNAGSTGVVSEVVADIMLVGGTVYIASWQIVR